MNHRQKFQLLSQCQDFSLSRFDCKEAMLINGYAYRYVAAVFSQRITAGVILQTDLEARNLINLF